MFPLGLPLLINLKAGHLHLLSTTLNAFKEVLNNYTIYYWSQVMNNFKYLVSCQYLWVVKFRIEGRRRVLTVTRVIRASNDGSFTGRDCKALNKDTILKSFFPAKRFKVSVSQEVGVASYLSAKNIFGRNDRQQAIISHYFPAKMPQFPASITMPGEWLFWISAPLSTPD